MGLEGLGKMRNLMTSPGFNLAIGVVRIVMYHNLRYCWYTTDRRGFQDDQQRPITQTTGYVCSGRIV
jgi:hypothetical protein